MSLVKHSLLSIASTPSEVVKQVLASIESQEVFNFRPKCSVLSCLVPFKPFSTCLETLSSWLAAVMLCLLHLALQGLVCPVQLGFHVWTLYVGFESHGPF